MSSAHPYLTPTLYLKLCPKDSRSVGFLHRTGSWEWGPDRYEVTGAMDPSKFIPEPLFLVQASTPFWIELRPGTGLVLLSAHPQPG